MRLMSARTMASASMTRVTGGKESRQKASPDTPLLPGDIVEIPERFF